MFCGNCGSKMDGDIKFCSNCGQSMGGNQNFQQSTAMRMQKVDFFCYQYSKFFLREQLFFIRESLSKLSEDRFAGLAYSLDLKNPVGMFWLSFFLGGFGIDRFRLGHVGLGIGKLLVGGLWILAYSSWRVGINMGDPDAVFGLIFSLLLSIWWFVDLFLIMNATRLYNYDRLVYNSVV